MLCFIKLYYYLVLKPNKCMKELYKIGVVRELQLLLFQDISINEIKHIF